MGALLLGLALFAGACATGSEPVLTAPLARIEAGVLRGAAGEGFEVFRGIPYAAPPVGELRWRVSAAAPAWGGVRGAREAGPACPQPRAPEWGDVGVTSEDCLYLDVWRPAGVVAGADLPVMVWIHGGAFLIGSGSLPLYDGAALARRDAIVVSINYRLGLLGFLSHPALSAEQGGASGNYGLLDQIAALRWVERNIAAFGGDPGNVTVFGESAGGLSILALMASPLADGLFDKAIVQSGAGLSVFPPVRQAEAAGAAWAAASGHADATADDLRGLSVDQVLAGQTFIGPVVDGAVLWRSPGDAFARGEQARIPLIIGSNSFEASLTFLNEPFARAAVGEAYDVLLAQYAEREPVDEARLTLIGELFGVQPARVIAAQQQQAGVPSYLYYFDQVDAARRGSLHGAPHGGELAYLFGAPLTSPDGDRWDEADRRVSRAMIGYWTAFARTGDPNHDGAPRWEAMQDANGRALHFGENIEMGGFDALADQTRDAAVTASERAWGR